MDQRLFDDLARQIASRASSRRSAIKSLAGVAVGGALSLAGFRTSEAATCRSKGQTCRENANCCSKWCVPAGQFRDRRARCGCENGEVRCGDVCADLGSDAQNCGACGVVAETDRYETCCDGQVVSLGTTANCSACGDDCSRLGSDYHCALGLSGLFCTNAPCAPHPSGSASAPNPTGTVTCTVIIT